MILNALGIPLHLTRINPRSGIFNQLFQFDSGGRFSDMGGFLKSNSKTWLAYWGPNWLGTSANLRIQTDRNMQNLFAAGYFNKLSQYRGIMPPVWGGSVILPTIPGNGFGIPDINNAFLDVVRRNLIPAGSPLNDETIAIYIIPQPQSRGSTSLTSFAAGYHTYGFVNNKAIAYGFSFPYQSSMTAILAHEIVELVSDPFPTGGKTISEVQNRDGIVDVSLLADKNSQYELADVCANGVFSIVNGTSVEPYWSNIDNGCVVPRSNADLGLITEQVIPNEGTAPDGLPCI